MPTNASCHDSNHPTPTTPHRVPLPPNSRAQVSGVHCRKYALPLNHTGLTNALMPPLLARRPRHQGHPRGAPLRFFAAPRPPPLTRVCLPTGRRPPLLPCRGRCALARPSFRLRQSSPLRSLGCADHPLVSAISENAEKLQCASRSSNPSPQCPTVVATRAHRRSCLRRMGEISERLLQ